MSDLGQLLRKARLEKNISIGELEETTKIRKHYLEAIEEGNFKVLPGNFYVRAFIKSYSEAVGLDPDEVLRLYHYAIPSAAPEERVEPLRRKRRRAGNSEKIGKLASGVLMWSFVLLIIVLIYYFVNQSYKDNGESRTNEAITDQRGSVPSGQTSSPVPTPTPTISATPTPQPETPAPAILEKAETQGKIENYWLSDASDPNHINLQMTITGEKCWVGVYKVIDGKNEKIYEGNLFKDDVKEWVSDQSVYINVGRENSLQLTINGIPFQYGDTPNSRKIQINIKDEIAGL